MADLKSAEARSAKPEARQSRATHAALDRFVASLLAMTIYSAATATGCARATRCGMLSQNMATTADTNAKAASA
jgi:hypothetical protein